MTEEMVEIRHYFRKKNGKVFKVQSIDGGDWEWIETPYTEIPYMIYTQMPKAEFKLLKETND
jgi:hypothetical protein